MKKYAHAGSVGVFWGEIAPCEHVVQIYGTESVFMDSLADFAGRGLDAGEAVVVIATAAHRSSLAARLRDAGHDLDAACADNRYLVLDAADTLSRFMVDGWPDEACFFEVVRGVIAQVRHEGRRVRVFGEMVALLWADGRNGATVRVEHLWNELCRDESLALFCAYPRIGATREINEAFAEVCAAHSRVAFV